MRRKMVEIVVREYFTPIKRDLNVEIKRVMKSVEDNSNNLASIKLKQLDIQQQLDLINVTIL